MVEWRKGKKPDAGWPMHNAKIIRVSANRTPLEEAIKSRIRESKSNESSKGKRKPIASKRMLESSSTHNPPQKSQKVKLRKLGISICI